jgi:hypothetical protein
MERRKAIKIVTLGALAGAASEGLSRRGMASGFAWSPGAYQLAFFSEDDNRLLDQLMELIIPADDHSPGAHAAQVSLFADLMVSTSGAAEQERWRKGLAAMRAEVGGGSTAQALAKAAANESHPATDLDRFFVVLKQMTIDGYYTSEIGIHQELNYQGNTYLSEFAGCDHAMHE